MKLQLVVQRRANKSPEVDEVNTEWRPMWLVVNGIKTIQDAKMHE